MQEKKYILLTILFSLDMLLESEASDEHWVSSWSHIWTRCVIANPRYRRPGKYFIGSSEFLFYGAFLQKKIFKTIFKNFFKIFFWKRLPEKRKKIQKKYFFQGPFPNFFLKKNFENISIVISLRGDKNDVYKAPSISKWERWIVTKHGFWYVVNRVLK